jgi:protein ImuA
MLSVLRRRMEEIESWGGSGLRSRVATGVSALDGLFPGGGMRRGTLVELLSSGDGAGAWTLGLAMVQRVCGEGKVLVVVDERSWFYPPGACALGLDLRRCLVVRPAQMRQALAAMRQALLCGAVGGVIGWFDRLGAVDGRRLRLAAESGGGVGLLVRPAEAAGLPTGAAARLVVSSIATGEPARRFKVEVLRGRGRGQALTLELDDETGDVRLPAGLASPAAAARTARPAR